MTPLLAVCEGPPTRTRPWPPWPPRTAATRQALAETHDHQPWWQNGHSVAEELEVWLAAEFGLNALAVSSGTTALETALRALNIGRGDEVLVAAATFLSTASAVTACGAVPIPVDVDPATLTLDVDHAAAVITGRTRAVIPVHLAGHPADLTAVTALARRHALAVIEDSAQAVTASTDQIRIATSSDAAILSFQTDKLLPGGEGGAVLLRDAQAARRAELLANNGRERGSGAYNHHRIATNARITVWAAALVLAHTSTYEQLWRTRERHRADLARTLTDRGYPDLLVGPGPRVTRHDHYNVVLRMPAALAERGITAATFAQALTAEGIPAKGVFPPWQSLPAYRDHPAARQATPHAEQAAATVVALPHPVLLEAAIAEEATTALDKITRRGDDLLRWQHNQTQATPPIRGSR